MTMESQSSDLNGHSESMTIEQMKESFDLIIKQIDQNNHLLSDGKFLKESVELLIHSNDIYISHLTIINHRIFVIIRDYYLNLFQRWHSGEKLDQTSSFIFETISNLFLKLSSHLSNQNLSILKELIFDQTLINQLNRFLEDLSINNKYLEDPQIKSVDNLFRTIERLERTPFDNKKANLFGNIVKCICSSSFIEIFRRSISKENGHPGENFLLNTCTDYISSHSIDKEHKQSLIDIRQSILQPFTEWIVEQSSLFRSWNKRILILLRQISFLLTLSIQVNQSIILDQNIFNCYCHLIDSFINILYSIIQSNPISNNKIIQSFILTLIPNLYTMTLSNQLDKYIQNKHITSLIFKLTNFDNDEIQLNAFQILSSITTEQDTKNNLYSNNIAKIFLNSMKKMIDNSDQTLTFYNLLRCLKNLIQYDQIKEEFIKQNGLSLIIRCATETKFQPLQVQQPALEIVLALIFNKDAYQQLKSNSDQLKACLSSSHQGISRPLEYILWKLEKEEELLSKEIIHKTNSKYDIIFSYSHSDQDLCLRISDQLVKDGFRLWINQDETFLTTMNEKCQMIDSCQYFLMCISDSFKQNLFCRCETSYASQRQCHIIPLIVTSNYRPDGWINRLISAKISIDFTKLDFQMAQIKLKSEIERQRKYLQINSQNYMKTPIQLPIKNERSSEIDQWTNEDVKLFLVTQNLSSLLPISSEMNGHLLHELYRMCLANRESMFHTLKNELSTFNSSHPPLTLIIYLRFLSEIQKYIPVFVINQK